MDGICHDWFEFEIENNNLHLLLTLHLYNEFCSTEQCNTKCKSNWRRNGWKKNIFLHLLVKNYKQSLNQYQRMKISFHTYMPCQCNGSSPIGCHIGKNIFCCRYLHSVFFRVLSFFIHQEMDFIINLVNNMIIIVLRTLKSQMIGWN